MADLHWLFSYCALALGDVFRLVIACMTTTPQHCSRGHLGRTALGAIAGTSAVYITVHGACQRIHELPDREPWKVCMPARKKGCAWGELNEWAVNGRTHRESLCGGEA
jgi:hypothetical protein